MNFSNYFMLRKAIFSFVLIFTTWLAAAEPSLPFVSPMFGDHMVLQRGKKNTFWGWSKPGDKIRVEIADKTADTVADKDGRWQVKILPPAAGGPYTVKIEGSQ